MRHIPFLLLLAIPLSCTSQKSEKLSTTKPDASLPPAYVSIDTSDGQPFRTVIDENNTNLQVSEQEIQFIDRLLQRHIDAHNRKSDKVFFIDLSKYKRQYFPTLNARKEKEVEINCFCSAPDNDDWKTQRIMVKDGGNCYFTITVNIKTGQISRFHINGLA